MKKKYFAASIVILCCIFMTGCPGTPDEPQYTGLVLGQHKYFPAVSLNTETIYSAIYDTVYSYGSVSAVVVDGKPSLVGNYQISKPKQNIDEAKRKQLAVQNVEIILNDLSQANAKVPEIDTLAAITTSANAIQAAGGENMKQMLIYDSGLGTTGLLSFAEHNWIDEPVEGVVEQLKELHALPNLTGINIIWVGLGETCGGQQPLGTNFKYQLQTFWKAILKEGGAASVVFDITPISSTENTADLPECSTVPVVAEELTAEKIPEIFKWDENSYVNFKSDRAEFIDVTAAQKAMQPVAEYLKAYPEEKIYIFGMTATVPGGDSGVGLSKQRGQACKDILTQLGADESQIEVVGLGHIDNLLRVKDIDQNGEQIPEMAAKNRAVFIIRSDAGIAEELLKIAAENT